MTMNDMNSFNARVALRQHGNDYAKSTKYMNTSGFFSPENIPNICVREINSRDRITCMVCVGEGKYMVTGHYSDGLKVWDLQTQKQVRHFGNAYDSERVLNVNLLSPTSPLIIVASAFQKGFSIWNWMTGKLYDEITHNCAIMYGRKNLLSFGGKYVIAACSDPDRNICVWDIEEKSKCLTIGGDAWSNDWIMAIEFCSDGYILSCTNYGKINMWDIDTLEAISWDGHDGVHSICLVDRKRLASGGEDNLVKIWNINIKKAKPSLLYQLGGHTDMIRQVSLIGKSILCSAANDTTVKVWNLDNKKCIATLTHPHSCINVMLMPKSYFLASSDSWNTMKIWSSGMKFLGQGVYECLSRNVFCDVRVQIN